MNLRILILVLICSHCNAQSIHYDWVKHIGGEGYQIGSSVSVDKDQNTYAVGFLDSNNTNCEVYSKLFKIDSTGNILWSTNQIYGKGTANRTVNIDSENNIIVSTGVMGNSINIDSTVIPLNSKHYYTVIQKFDQCGSLMWYRIFEGISGSGIGAYNQIAVDKNNNIYFGGVTSPKYCPVIEYDTLTTSIHINPICFKLNSDGDLCWYQRFSSDNHAYFYSITCDNTGNVYAIGTSYGSLLLDSFPLISGNTLNMNYIIRFNANGEFSWISSFGVTVGNVSNVTDIVADQKNDIYFAGNFTNGLTIGSYQLNNPGLGTPIFLAKIDSFGQFKWAKQGKFGLVRNMWVSSNNNIILIGQIESSLTIDNTTSFPIDTQNSIYIAVFSGDGDVIKLVTLGGFDPYCITSDKYGKYYYTGQIIGNGIFGETSISTNATYEDPDMFIAKFGTGETGISEVKSSPQVTIFPNPTDKTVEICFDSPLRNKTTVNLLDSSGKIINKFKISADTKCKLLNVDGLNSGTYILEIESKDLHLNKKVIIK